MKKLLFLVLLFLGLYSNINATTTQPNNFMKLPISWIHPIEGNEWVSNNPETINVTFDEFIKYGLNPKAILTWEQIEPKQYILNMIINDRMIGEREVIKILFIKKNTPVRRGEAYSTERVLIRRIVINGNDLTLKQIFKFMLDTCNSISVLHKQHTPQPKSELKEEISKLREASGYYKPIKSTLEERHSEGRTITAKGIIIFATLDSAIEINDGEDSIGFLTNSEIGNKIFSICKVGEYCEITGIVNNEFFLSVSKVKTLN